LLARRQTIGRHVAMDERKRGLGDLAGAEVLDVAALAVADNLDKRQRSGDGGAFRPLPLVLGVFLAVDLGEERRQVVVLALRPTLERMIVALVAIEAD